MTTLAIVSWSAVTIGFIGTWIAGRRASGWLWGVASSVLWLGYDLERAIWAGAFAAVVAIILSLRNYILGRKAAAHPVS